MQMFHCAHYQHLLFFENVQCVRCGHPLAYLPDLDVVSSLEPAGDAVWQWKRNKNSEFMLLRSRSSS